LSLDINVEEFRKFKKSEDQGPVVMLNLLKFKPDGGAQRYGRYASQVEKMVTDRGGKTVYAGLAGELLTGSEEWDAVLLVRYPSRQAFLDMIKSAEYQKAHKDREAALERAVLYETRPGDLRSMGV